MDNARHNPRMRTLKAGRVVYRKGSCMLDCLIRDMSAEGARLRFSQPVILPEELELLIVAENRRVPARPVWHRGTDVGIVFLRSA